MSNKSNIKKKGFNITVSETGMYMIHEVKFASVTYRRCEKGDKLRNITGLVLIDSLDKEL